MVLLFGLLFQHDNRGPASHVDLRADIDDAMAAMDSFDWFLPVADAATAPTFGRWLLLSQLDLCNVAFYGRAIYHGTFWGTRGAPAPAPPFNTTAAF